MRHPKVLVLFRHAKSSWDDPELEDFERPLADRGRKAAKLMAAWLKKNGVQPDLILCSPAVRTRQTLDLVRSSFPKDVAIRYEPELYLAEAPDLLQRIRKTDDACTTLMVLGHNPGLQDLALKLAPEKPRKARARMEVKFPTAAIAQLQLNVPHWAKLTPGQTELLTFIVPADLKDD